MTIDKQLVTHIVAELIIISGLAYYYHKKCGNLQLQINDLNTKLEKMNGINYLNTVKRHEMFETQTVQHINKIYSLLNNLNNNGNINDTNGQNPMNQMNLMNQMNSINPMNSMNLMNQMNNENVIKESFYGSSTTNEKNTISQTKPSQNNPLMNTLSMLGPLTTMFKVVMEPKPPHPNEVFENININSQLNNQKIVEIEDDDSETLDNELKEELNDLRSNVTTAMNTPIFTPKISNVSNVPSLDLCDNNVCKLNLDNIKEKDTKITKIDDSVTSEMNMSNVKEENVNENVMELKQKENNEVNNVNNNETKITKINEDIDKSSPLRYISQPLESKRGRPKKIDVRK